MPKRAAGTPRPPTISDVAAEAGVSIATVSRVLSGNESVRPELAQRVRDAATYLQYRANPAARDLARGAGSLVAVIAPNVSNPYFSDILRTITVAAARDGYQVIIADTRGLAEVEAELVERLQGQAVGVIILSSRLRSQELRALAAGKFPTVLVNRAGVGIGLPSVSVDVYAATLSICGHLATLGHKRVAFLAGEADSWQNIERLRALANASAFGLQVTTVQAGSSIERGHDSLGAALKNDPTAIIAFNDLTAFGALARLRELGLRVPLDMSLVGFDDIAFASYADPPITTADAPRAQLAEDAWATMLRVLRGEDPGDPDPISAPLVIRGSTATPRHTPLHLLDMVTDSSTD